MSVESRNIFTASGGMLLEQVIYSCKRASKTIAPIRNSRNKLPFSLCEYIIRFTTLIFQKQDTNITSLLFLKCKLHFITVEKSDSFTYDRVTMDGGYKRKC